MWNEMARALGLNLPVEQVERIAPALEALWPLIRRTFDRDLSATDPAIVFRAGDGAGQ